MRSAAAFVLLAFTVPLARADGESADDHAFVEVAAPRDAYFVHEPIRLRVRIGYDEAFFRANVLQMFQRRLDVPARLDAPWLRELPGAEIPPDEPQAAGDRRGRLTFALGDDVVAAARVEDRAKDGRTFAVVELTRRFLPERPGELTIAAPELRFAYATRFEDDFVRGRMPLDRRDGVVRGAPLALTIRALPEDGRPAEFTGAVGRFTVRAQSDRDEVAVGEHFKLTLSIEGDGDLAHFEPPRLDGAPGFHVYGLLDDRQPARRVLTYDVAALSADVTETPSIAFAAFDPGPPAGYRVERTPSVPLRVRAAAGAKSPRDETAPGQCLTGPVNFLLVLAAAAGVLLYRRLRRPAPDTGAVRIRAAAHALETSLAASGADVAAAFAQFLAACLDCRPAAVISPDLARRLAVAGVPEDLARRAALHLEGLVAARYGGSERADSAAVRALASEIAAALGDPRGPTAP